jgi:hypothetical protein
MSRVATLELRSARPPCRLRRSSAANGTAGDLAETEQRSVRFLSTRTALYGRPGANGARRIGRNGQDQCIASHSGAPKSVERNQDNQDGRKHVAAGNQQSTLFRADGAAHMKFILVNGRTPSPYFFCALCCEPIGGRYLREIATRLSYCDHKCYLGDPKDAVPVLQYQARAS